MKPTKSIPDLAATLTAAASAPLVPAPAKSVKKAAGEGGTQPLTLRAPRSLYVLYVNKAAERSKLEGRNVSVQEVMLEVLANAGGGKP
jgi:hypothetical protein